jgi:hypothetical protein
VARFAILKSYDRSAGADYLQAFHTYYITAVAEGGRTTDVIHTDATVVKAWEKFRFINGGPTDPYFSIQTLAGYFLSAVNSGGLIANAITSAATSVGDWPRASTNSNKTSMPPSPSLAPHDGSDNMSIHPRRSASSPVGTAAMSSWCSRLILPTD